MDYKKIGMKSGIEIHKQLESGHKLFCSCKPNLADRPINKINRKLRPVAGELGDIDVATLHETMKNKKYEYAVYPEESCLVETDSEPPHEINRDALETVLKIAVMLNCDIPDEIHVMRKIVIDGSNTSGFQRTAIVGTNGYINTSFGKVGIDNISIEEESSQILKKEKNTTRYGLDRLGIPLVEIGTAPDMHTPEQAKEVAKKLGNILKSTGKVKRGLGTIRQDLNVSIKSGNRVEIKGVQDLDMIPEIVRKEAERQQKTKNVTKDVRRALPNGSTEFMRPLPGAARLYPETDIPPIRITHNYLKKIGSELPEDMEKRTARFVKKYKINKEIADQLIDMNNDQIFEAIVAEGLEPRIVSRSLTSTFKDLRRQRINVDDIPGFRIIELFKEFKKKTKDIPKEAITEGFTYLAKDHYQDLTKLVEKIGVKRVSETEVRKIVKSVIEKNRDVLNKNRPENILMGLIMKETRGKIPGALIMKILKEELK